MSYDPNANVPPVGNVPPQKSGGGALKWILGGIGCFGLLTALCIGGFIWWAYNLSQDLIINNPAKIQAIAEIEQSETVGDAFGRPVTVSLAPPQQPQQKGQGGLVLTFEGEVKGSEKSGTATVVVDVANALDAESSTVESIVIKDADGNEIPVKKLDLDINIEEGETVTE